MYILLRNLTEEKKISYRLDWNLFISFFTRKSVKCCSDLLLSFTVLWISISVSQLLELNVPVWHHNIILSSNICILTFPYPVWWCPPALECCSLPLLSSHVEYLAERVELLASSGCVCLSVLLCLSACWQTGCQVHIIWAGGGKPVTLTYVLWFQSPHIPTYTLTHPVPAAALRMGVFHSKTPIVIFSSTSHSFTWNCALLGKGNMFLLPQGLLLFESETEL